MLFRRYNPIKYWTKRGIGYDKEIESPYFSKVTSHQRSVLRKYLEQVSPSSVLEVGCGTGRMFEAYLNVNQIIGLDFSCTMLNHAKKTKKQNLLLVLASASNIPLKDKSVECTVTCETLLHVPSKMIDTVTKEITRVTSKYIICLEYFEEKKVKLEPHCFLHNYTQLFLRHNLELINQMSLATSNGGLKQTCFMFQKKGKCQT